MILLLDAFIKEVQVSSFYLYQKGTISFQMKAQNLHYKNGVIL